MKKCICFIFDKNYAYQGEQAILSAKKHNPEHTTILLTDDLKQQIADIQINKDNLSLQDNTWLTVGRVSVVEYALSILNFDTAIFIDGDTYTYNSYSDLQNAAENNSMVVIPHITKPLPNDQYVPQNRIISLSGNYNTGVWAASKNGLDFIRWWREQTALFPITRSDLGLVNEQGWLRFAGDFDSNTKIFRHPGYNVAYWNIKQRELSNNNGTILIDNQPLCVMHFSGLKSELCPSQMSVFQTRYTLQEDDLAYQLYSDYHKLIWG